jgi:tripartite-type tricarboxylate transporter receptor subunit TctC
MVRKKLFVACAALVATLGFAGGSYAQDKFPSRPINIVVPGPPGGGTDTIIRKLAEVIEPELGTKLVIENKPGGGGAIGVALVTQARPDGYSLVFSHNGALTTIQHTLQLPYTLESYQPIIQIGYGSYVMCVAADFPANTAKEFLDELRSKPGHYTYGNDGVGSTMHLAAEQIFRKFDIKAKPVPFGGAGETARNFLGGHIDIYGGSLPPVIAHVKAGKVKCLLLTQAANNPVVPQASGLKDLGIPELEVGLWWGLIGPKGLPDNVMKTLVAAFTKGAAHPAVQETLARIGASPTVHGPDEYKAMIAQESASLGEAAKAIGLLKK